MTFFFSARPWQQYSSKWLLKDSLKNIFHRCFLMTLAFFMFFTFGDKCIFTFLTKCEISLQFCFTAIKTICYIVSGTICKSSILLEPVFLECTPLFSLSFRILHGTTVNIVRLIQLYMETSRNYSLIKRRWSWSCGK